MRIFIINLANRADRRESAARQLAGTGLDYEFFRAIEAPGALAQHFEGRDDRNAGAGLMKPTNRLKY